MQASTTKKHWRSRARRFGSPLDRVIAAVTTGTMALFGAVAVSSPAFAGPDDPIAIPDSALQSCINGAIDPTRDAAEDVTESEAAGITYLLCDSQGVRSLIGIEHLTGLKTLTLNHNQIEDLTAFSGMSAPLEVLMLGYNQIEDFTPLSGLTSLVALDLGVNSIQDLSLVAGLTSLEDLWLGGNQIEDLSPVTGLTSLQRVDLDDNQILDLSPLAGKALTSFTAEDQIVDIGDVAVDEATGNPVVDRSGDPVALSDLYDASSNTFTPRTLGAGTVTWDDGNKFTGTLEFTTVDSSVNHVAFTDANLRACVNHAIDPARDAGEDVTETEAASHRTYLC